MRKRSSAKAKAYKLLLAINRASIFSGVDMRGVPPESDLTGFTRASLDAAPQFLRYTQLDAVHDKVLCESSLAVNAVWRGLKSTDIALRTHITDLVATRSESFRVMSQQIDVVVATKAAFDSVRYFDYASPTYCDESEGKKCLFVMKFVLRFLPSGRCHLEIRNRGVHPDLRRRGLMKRSTVAALVEIYKQHGDMLVTNYAVHPATNLFFATTESERITALTHFDKAPVGTVSGEAGVAMVNELAGIAGLEAISPRTESSRDEADVDSVGVVSDASTDEEKIHDVVSVHNQKSLRELLVYHCRQLRISFDPDNREVSSLQAGDVRLFAKPSPDYSEQVLTEEAKLAAEEGWGGGSLSAPAA
ncbi:MAG: hypothetical protein P1U63_07750 [Coxiellaceae bacterium]|nr:hypothetical protein [Coxiellaceae bacterium]